jgi:hypothetical protein
MSIVRLALGAHGLRRGCLFFTLACNSTQGIHAGQRVDMSATPDAAARSSVAAVSLSDQAGGRPDVERYLGAWHIQHFAKVREPALTPDAYPSSQVGKSAILSREAATFEGGFLWVGGKSCSEPSYRWASDDEFIGHASQALLPIDHPDRRAELLFLDVDCEGSNIFGCEVTRQSECAAYYDGYAFFLSRDPRL